MNILIAAAAENNALGKNNEMVWHLPDDFKRFKQLTTGHHIIMGRKTFESFPKPLPNRIHIVITRQKDYNPQGCIVVSDLDDAIAAVPKEQDAYIIGGGEIFKLAIPIADKIELTRIHQSYDGDAFFPEINLDDWKIVESHFHPTDEKHASSFTFETYLKKEKQFKV